MSWKCECCEEEITKKDEYIEYDGERFCSDCYQADTSTSYFIGGEYLANDGDGVVEYGLWNLEEEAE